MGKQKNRVTKWSPVSPMDFPRFESWLEEMAGKGFLVHRVQQNLFSLARVKFRRDEPHPHRRYRVCPAQGQQQSQEKPSQELLELYAGAGWTYEGDIGRPWTTLYLFSTDDPEAQEPYTDPDSLYEALRPPKKDLVNDLFLGAFFMATAIFISVRNILDEKLALLPNWVIAAAAWLIIARWVLGLAEKGLDWLTVRALRRNIRATGTVRPSPPSPLSAAGWLLSTLGSLVQTGFLAMVLLMFLQLVRMDLNLPLERFDPDFDLLTLAEMEGDGSWTPEPDLEVADQLLRFNAADVYQDPGRGVQMWYDVSQAGYGTSGDSSMDLNYFVSDDAQAAWELLAGLVQDLQSPDGDLLSYLPDSLPFQRETVPGAEEFLVRREGENWDVVALEGDRVLALRYSGALDLTDWYGEITAMLTPEG